MSANPESETYKAAPGGIQDSIKGVNFQMNLLELFALRAFNKSIDFYVWTEDADADKFDDVLYMHKDNNQINYSFLQAKHKVNPITFSLETFFTDKNYNLYKYFCSFMKIEQNFEINYKDINLNDLYIATNNLFPSPSGDGLITLKAPSNIDSVLVFEQQEPNENEIFHRQSLTVKLSLSKEAENFNFLRIKFLSVELARFLFENGNPEGNLLPHSKEFLTDFVFNVTGNSVKFKNEFLNKGYPEAEYLRELIDQAISSRSVKLSPGQKKNYWNYLKKMKLTDDLIKKILGFKSDTSYVKMKIKRFMNKLVFVAGLSESILNINLKQEILKIVNDVHQLNKTFFLYEKAVKDWLSRQFSTNNYQEKVSYSFIAESFETVLEKNVFTNSYLDFSDFKELENFLSSQNDQILINEVAAGETFWGCVRWHRLKTQIFYMKLDDLGNAELQDMFDIFSEVANSTVLLIECIHFGCFRTLNGFIEKFSLSESKAKLVIVCDAKLSAKFPNHKKIINDKLVCGQLTNNSLDILLKKEIKFQGILTKLNALIEKHELYSMDFKLLDDIQEVGNELKEPQIYLNRSLIRHIRLKAEILKNFPHRQFADEIIVTEPEPNFSLRGNLHTLKKIKNSSQLEWEKSSGPVKVLNPYIDTNKPSQMSEDEFLINSSQITIIKGLPGMGKSIFAEFLSSKLKTKNNWVQIFKLAVYTDALQNFLDESLKKEETEKIRAFFISNFMKLNAISELIFKRLLSKGNVVFIFDGFDEISQEYQNPIMMIISSFSKLSKENKFYISTRPELAETIENQFHQFSYDFNPFTHEDQEKYLLEFWKEKCLDPNTDKVERILKKIDKSITDKERKFTGVPLITRLVAEYFDVIINEDDEEFDKCLSSEISTYALFDHFVRKKFDIYMLEKIELRKNIPEYNRKKKSLENRHLKLAVKLLFEKNWKELCSSKDYAEEDDLDDFLRCGLVELIDEERVRFHHNTYAEFLFVVFSLKEFNKNGKVLHFLFEVVLVDNGCQMIRSLLNQAIGKDKTVNFGTEDNTKIIVKEFITKNTDALKIAVKETNYSIFESLCKTLDEDFLLQKDKNDCNLFFNLIGNYDVDEIFFDILNNQFGLDFVKKLLLLENDTVNDEQGQKMSAKKTIMSAAGEQGKNYLTILNWTIQNFSEDLETVKCLITWKDHFGNTVLHHLTKNFDKQNFIDFMELAKSLENNQSKFLDELLLHQNRNNEIFISILVENFKTANSEAENFTILTELLEYFIEDKLMFEKLLLVGRTSVINQVTNQLKTQTLDFFEYLSTRTCFGKFFMTENKSGNLFYDDLMNNNMNGISWLTKNALSEVVSMLNFLICKNIEIKESEDFEKFLSNIRPEVFSAFSEKTVNFQGFSVNLNEIIGENQLDIVDFETLNELVQIATAPKPPELYTARNLTMSNCLQSQILNDFESRVFKDVLVFNESEYSANLNKNRTVHLVKRVQVNENCKQLLWIKSSGSIDTLKPYIDINSFSQISDKDLLTVSSQITIINGLSGMGKSTLLQYLCNEFKEKNPGFWVQNFQRHDYSDLKDFQLLNKSDTEVIRDFFVSKILKVIVVEQLIFKRLLSKGKVILLFDEFEEIGEEHQHIMKTIIFALIKLSKENKFYISARGKCVGILEDWSCQFSYGICPFSVEDQVNYLLKFLQKDSSYSSQVRAILENISSLSDFENTSHVVETQNEATLEKLKRTFTSTPMNTRLVGEYFIDRVDDENLLEDTLQNFTHFNFINFYFNEKLKIFLMEKFDLTDNNLLKSIFGSLKSDIIVFALELSMPNLFEESVKTRLKNPSSDEINVLIDCGLMEFTNGKLTFIDQIMVKFLAALYFFENLTVPIFQILFEVVLVEKEYQMIRFFINDFIKDVVNDNNKPILSKLIKNHKTILDVAKEESNLEIFNVLSNLES